MNAESVVFVAYGSDPLETLAALMLERHQRNLPDLSPYVALFPHPGAIPGFRRALLAAAERCGQQGLLAPWCGTLDGWLQQQALGDFTLIDGTERELLLLEALEPYPDLRERFGAWSLIDSLLALFDELNAHRHLPDADVNSFAALLAAGYGIEDTTTPLRDEAQLVHTLWTAWNEHLLQHGLMDRGLQRLTALASRKSRIGAPAHIYVVGAMELATAEAQWLKALLQDNRGTLLLHGGLRAPPDHPNVAVTRCLQLLDAPVPFKIPAADSYSQFIDEVYASEPDLAHRAHAFAQNNPKSPATTRLSTYTAASFEQEARAIDLAVRRWRAAGLRNIGIVTHDRKLARRVRALLERANLQLRDSAGWALSTTSAATVVVRWLECVEQDFAYRPLLDFLKSPFTTLGFERSRIKDLVDVFEQNVVRARNVSSGLDRYRRALETRVSDERIHELVEPLTLLLDRLHDAAEPLAQCRRGTRPPAGYLDALQLSLERTGLQAGLGTDAAGAQVLTVLRPGRRRLTARGVRLTWAEFHRWLQREFERSRFHPPRPDDGIELLGLAESRCRTFDALVLAGCNRDHLPGRLAISPFFNDGARSQLGLPTRQERLAVPFNDFRRLLEAAPRVLITWRCAELSEPLIPNPWTERLVTFHRLAYSQSLEETALAALLASPQTELLTRDAPLPGVASLPAPSLPAARLPSTLTASSHQQLVNCPYQFFAAALLGLRPLDAVREELEKSDYGQRVHRILQAFHAGVPGLPGPWRDPISADNRPAAAALLRDLGRRVFAYDKDRRFSTRGWQYRWESLVPAYLDWQQEWERTWRTQAMERAYERDIVEGLYTLKLRGRLDRIDRGSNGIAVLDYKTGAIPKPDEVMFGESSQLPFYALLPSEPVRAVAFAELDPNGVKMKTAFEGDALAELVSAFELRLRAMMRALQAGANMPAWGDNHTCEWCAYQSLCRKEMWRAVDE